MSGVSWVTYARPFAKRISTYRRIQEKRRGFGDFDYAGDDYIECVRWTWYEFKKHMWRIR